MRSKFNPEKHKKKFTRYDVYNMLLLYTEYKIKTKMLLTELYINKDILTL